MVQDSIDAIANWLRNKLGARVCNAHAGQGSDWVLFRSELPDDTTCYFDVSEKVLRTVAPEDILIDLAQHRVPERLKRDPTMRLAYNSDRDVPHIETRLVQLDGRWYRLVRDSHHAVRIFDAKNRLLAGTPSPLPVLPVSIFSRDLPKLEEDIRDWRGADQ